MPAAPARQASEADRVGHNLPGIDGVCCFAATDAGFGDPLKLHADPLTSLNTVTAYGAGFVEINRTRHSGALVFGPDVPVSPWAVGGFDGLTAERIEELLPLRPELVLLGTGERQRFPGPAVLQPLAAAGIGVEVMSTPAACRTYNILMSEGRRVIAAFLQDA
jgi:uncharacterized protein